MLLFSGKAHGQWLAAHSCAESLLLCKQTAQDAGWDPTLVSLQPSPGYVGLIWDYVPDSTKYHKPKFGIVTVSPAAPALRFPSCRQGAA